MRRIKNGRYFFGENRGFFGSGGGSHKEPKYEPMIKAVGSFFNRMLFNRLTGENDHHAVRELFNTAFFNREHKGDDG